jgi:outer membrane receptor protein involved in Fe transport
MGSELAKLGHPMMLATLLTISLASFALAQAPLPETPEPNIGISPIPELELIKEEETVSVASRYEQAISQAPANVYVITDEDIRHSGATDLPTILRRVPGIEVMQMSGADFNVSARGDNQPIANKMLVLVDGRSIYVDVQGIVWWKAIPVTLPEIKRIEVLKGPASSIYGFNAYDGIISIITKSPEEMKGTTLQFGGGSYGTISSAAIQAGTVGKLGYRLSVGTTRTSSGGTRMHWPSARTSLMFIPSTRVCLAERCEAARLRWPCRCQPVRWPDRRDRDASHSAIAGLRQYVIRAHELFSLRLMVRLLGYPHGRDQSAPCKLHPCHGSERKFR